MDPTIFGMTANLPTIPALLALVAEERRGPFAGVAAGRSTPNTQLPQQP